MKYDVFITKEGKWYIADVPALPGCMSQGKTEQEGPDQISRMPLKDTWKVLKEQNRDPWAWMQHSCGYSPCRNRSLGRAAPG
jgi:hypothetical protein